MKELDVLFNKLISEAKAELLAPRKYLHNGTAGTAAGQIDIRVAPKNVGRALRFMDTFVKVIYDRGHKIEIKRDNTYLIISDEEIEIVFREKLKRVVVKESTWDRTELVPTDVLSFRAKVLFNDFEWNDSKTLLEIKLSQIIAKLEIKAKEAQEERSIWKRNREIQDEKRRVEQERQARIEKEASDFKQLIQESRQWKESIVLEEYLNAIEQKMSEKGSLSEEQVNWLAWAQKKLDLYNPFEQRLKEVEFLKNQPVISPQ